MDRAGGAAPGATLDATGALCAPPAAEADERNDVWQLRFRGTGYSRLAGGRRYGSLLQLAEHAAIAGSGAVFVSGVV